MNIFVLSLSGCPIESARMHADQHLHKMILESAQMLSTALQSYGHDMPYKPAYQKHPCTQWTSKYIWNAYWLTQLATELENIRQELNHPYHESSHVIKLAKDILEEDYPFSIVHEPPKFQFIFAGPAHLSLRSDLSVPQKYQAYYKYKHKQWLDKGRGMSYKGRPIPSFMQEILAP